MTRVRVSTTVDETLLNQVRELRSGVKDAVLLDEAFVALLSHHRAAMIDDSYKVYESQPMSDSDDWGDLESFREAAGSS